MPCINLDVHYFCRFMKQVRPNGVMEDSPLTSPVMTSPHRKEVGVAVGGEKAEPKHRKGVKRNLEDVQGVCVCVCVRERERERERGHKPTGKEDDRFLHHRLLLISVRVTSSTVL